MASVRFDRTSDEFRFFTEFWQMVQKYYLPDDSAEYWEPLLTDAAILGKKYDGIFYRNIIQGFLNYAEEYCKEKE